MKFLKTILRLRISNIYFSKLEILISMYFERGLGVGTQYAEVNIKLTSCIL